MFRKLCIEAPCSRASRSPVRSQCNRLQPVQNTFPQPSALLLPRRHYLNHQSQRVLRAHLRPSAPPFSGQSTIPCTESTTTYTITSSTVIAIPPTGASGTPTIVPGSVTIPLVPSGGTSSGAVSTPTGIVGGGGPSQSDGTSASGIAHCTCGNATASESAGGGGGGGGGSDSPGTNVSGGSTGTATDSSATSYDATTTGATVPLWSPAINLFDFEPPPPASSETSSSGTFVVFPGSPTSVTTKTSTTTTLHSGTSSGATTTPTGVAAGLKINFRDTLCGGSGKCGLDCCFGALSER